MIKTLLASSALSLALLAMPMTSVGPLSTTGAAGLAPAHAEFGIDLGGIEIGGGDDDDGPTISLGGGDDDEGDDEDDDED
ncbi:MAG: hypothetical protein AB7F76_10520 [Parvibaculaceae bacterium]